MKKAIFLMLLLLAVLLGVFWQIFDQKNEENAPTLQVGDFLVGQKLDIDAIGLADKKMFLFKKGGVWQTEEGYPLEAKKVEAFLSVLEDVKLLKATTSEKDEKKEKIVFEKEGKTVLEFEVSSSAKGFAKVWQNAMSYELSALVPFYYLQEEWFFQPVVGFASKTEHPLADLRYINVLKKNVDWKPIKKFAFSLNEGLVFECFLYFQDGEYWLAVDLSLDMMPKREALKYAKNNAPLINGWMFLLSRQDGERLSGV